MKTLLCDLITKENGNIKVPMDIVEIEIEMFKNKDQIKMKYIFKDRSYAIVLFTKTEDYIIERGV